LKTIKILTKKLNKIAVFSFLLFSFEFSLWEARPSVDEARA